MIKAVLSQLFERDLNKLKEEIKAYTNETDLWKTAEGISNSGGNLCLHLIGNLKHFMGKTLGNIPYERFREKEFSDKNIPVDILEKSIDETLGGVLEALHILKEDELDNLIPLLEEHAIYERAEYNRKDKRERLAAELFKADSRLKILVVEIGEKIQGYCSYTIDYSTWSAARFLHMDCLFIREEFRGLGIGSVIIKKMMIAAKENDCVNLQWQTTAFNAQAIAFYKKNHAIGIGKVRFTLPVE